MARSRKQGENDERPRSATPATEESERSEQVTRNRGQQPRLQSAPRDESTLWREFLSQIEDESPVALHISAPDHDVNFMLNNIAALFGVVAVTVI